MQRPKLPRPGRPPSTAAPVETGNAVTASPHGATGGARSGGLRVGELHARQRSRALMATGVAILLAWVLLLGAYYLHPVRPSTASGAVVKMVVGVAVVATVIAVEYRRIVRARLPQLRAAEAFGVTLPLFLVVFSSLYLSLGQAPHPMFSATLDPSSALYFAVTVFSTVGFGDIVPTADAARLLVAAQMLIDLVFLAAVVRVLMMAATRGLERGA